MKKLLTILLTILTLTSYGQQRMVKAEKIIFRMVNEYRVSQGLETVVWSEDVYDAAYHHSSYMSYEEVNFSHSETVDIKGHEEINDPQNRIKKYCGKLSWGTECMAGMMFITWRDKLPNLEELCREVVNDWINSPGHRKAMLFDKEGHGNLKIGAVSVIHVRYCDSATPVLVLVHPK
tara:strand:- start:2523 stop:3053 length:531 start_codon:yes stop_codon:yes gene_type:complete